MTKKTALSTAVSIALGTVATIGGFNLAHAGVGYGVTTDPGFTTAGNPAYPDYTMPTFYANSELPKVVNGAVTGGLHKFVDTLAPLGCGTTNNLGQCIPIAVPNTAYQVNGADPFPGADYYEIGIVEYREQMHSDLPAAGTLLRGYVQLVPAGTSGAVALTEADGAPLTRIINGVPTQLYGATKPHYLGPIIVATKGVPVRVKYTNLLPIGAATNAAGTGPVVSGPVTGPDGAVYNKVSDFKRNGDLFIPTDTTLTGAGLGPDGATWYQQNRAELHLHGGLTPWISDGTPHQWTVPLNDPISLRTTPADDISGPTGIAGANVANIYGVGASFVNVPDMADPGQGSGTLYWTNDQSARLMFYHDHVSGITRLNVYVGEAAGYVLTDNVENALLNGDATLGINQALPGGVLDQIPLVIQDKTFVPSDIAMQDAKWDTTAWGQTGDLWFPHVYETNQDPASADGTNPVGRWDWGPWFWPVFNAQFGLPSGEYGDVTTTPEAFMDTPVVNGTAYPSLTVEPKAYRFRVLNAANDRMVNLGLYVAEPLSIGVADPGPGGYVDPRVVISGGGGSGATADALMGLQSITFADGTNTYTVPPTVAISAPPAGGIQATAIAVLQQTAINQPVALKEILITNPGDGYTTPPQITVTANSVDATSTAKTTISASATVGLAGIKVTNAGNYGQSGTTAPTITITEGPNGPTLPVVAVASVNTEVKMVPFQSGYVPPATLTPNGNSSFPTTGGLQGTGWGQMDMRVGGVPDPATAGPDIVQYGDEGGILPNPVVIPSTPINYEYNKRSVTVLNVLERGLFLGNAERADIVIDFSQYAGKTLIMYNDAPAPVPASDPRIDYYTGNPDMTDSGGAPSTLPGYGPNTRTVMQIKVGSGVTTPSTFSVATLKSELPKAYKASQDAPVVPAVAYNNAFGTSSKDTFASIYTGSASQKLFSWSDTAGAGAAVGSLSLTGGGTGYKTTPNVTIAAPGCTIDGTTCIQATATATINASTKKVTGLTLTNPGAGYTSQPSVVISGGGGIGATAQALLASASGATKQYPVYNKAIQELFEPVFGRMNATLGVEMPFTNQQNQTTVPLDYIDPETETIADGETQIWKITHNGVDTHPVHFHLVNVQVINRVGWDGTIKPPYDNEYGWKETVKMNPLEDIIVAVKAAKPKLPGFGLPQSYRPLDPSQALNTSLGFSQFDLNGLPIDVTTNADGTTNGTARGAYSAANPTGYNANFGLAVPAGTVSNVMASFGDEYVWHCHILGHEENDFMRAFVFDAKNAAPDAPTGVTAAQQQAGGVLVSWTDPTPANLAASLGNAKSEIGFRVQRKLNTGAYGDLGTTKQFTSVVNGALFHPTVNTQANATSFIDSSALVAPTAPGVPAAPTLQTATTTSITIKLPALPANASGFNVFNGANQVGSNVTGATFTDPTVLTPSTTYNYTLVAVGAPNVYGYRVGAETSVGETFSTPDATVTLANTNSNASTVLNATTLALSPVAPTTVVDNFNRANATNLGASWQQTGLAGFSVVRVNSNQATSNLLGATGYAYWNTVLGATQGAGFTFANNPANNNTALFLKASGNLGGVSGQLQNAIRVQYNGNGSVRVAYTTNGNSNNPTYTNVGNAISTGGNLANGNSLLASVDSTGKVYIWKVVGANITLLTANGVQMPNNVLWTTGGGKVGVSVPNGGRVDNFIAQ